MLALLFYLYFQTPVSCSEASLPPAVNASVVCRTERQEYLFLEQFEADTCARCYMYMSTSVFNFKLIYESESSVLRDPRTNDTYFANPFNASRKLLESFAEESAVEKWKACCHAALRCCSGMISDPAPPSGHTYCPRTWDGWQCWPDTPAGMTARQPCEGYIYFETNKPSCTKYASKQCWSNGTWYTKNLKEWTNYTKCGRRDQHRRFLYFHIATYIVTIISIIPALIIFITYKQLQVHRITMHKNLFLSLLLNGLVMVLFKSIFIAHELNWSDQYGSRLERNGVGCKILLILTKYFRMTNYMWMFCEALYLQKLIVAAFAEQRNLLLFYMIGWGFPILPVTIYAILRAMLHDETCWAFPVETYEWIMNIPNLFSMMVNMFFLINIIRVLVTKLRATHANEPSQYRKTVRATLVLVPLFGLHFCLVIYRPTAGRCGFLEAYFYFSYAMDGLQGFMVALIFCYLNGEVLYLIKRSYQRYKLRLQFRGSMQSSTILRRMSATQDSTMNESQNNHHLLHRTKAEHKAREIINHHNKVDPKAVHNV